MKKSLIALLLIGVVILGCKQKQIITDLENGRKQLFAGHVIDAIEDLESAEVEEVNKVEPRALLIIAYSHAISSDAAKMLNMEARFQNERDRRIGQLGEPEIKKILDILGERHRIQKDAVQVLIDRGPAVVPFVLENLVKNRYTKVHDDFLQILEQIGGAGVDSILETIGDSATPDHVKVTLIRVVGEIGDAAATAGLETLHTSIADEGLKMEVDTALYRLGHPEYKEKIIAGLSDANVIVRRASARALVSLDDPPTAKIVAALKDTDNNVRMYAAKALQKYQDANAVDNLIAVLNSITDSSADSETKQTANLDDNADSDAKQAANLKAKQASQMKQTAMDTLHLYAEKGIANGLAARFIELLTDAEVTDHNNRLRIVQLLKKPVLIKQVEEADQYDNLPHKIYQIYDAETNDMVKDELSKLLGEIKQDDGDTEAVD